MQQLIWHMYSSLSQLGKKIKTSLYSHRQSIHLQLCLSHLAILQTITRVYFTNDIMLIERDEQEETRMLKALVRQNAPGSGK